MLKDLFNDVRLVKKTDYAHLPVTLQILIGGVVKRIKKGEFVKAKTHIKLITGEVIKMLRELKGWTQKDLAKRSGITDTNISLLENEKIEIGKKRAEQLSKAFAVHPNWIVLRKHPVIGRRGLVT